MQTMDEHYSDTFPDCVMAHALAEGISAEEAYALYLEKREREKAIADAANALALERTPGCPRGNKVARLYSVEEMKSMSSKEVKSRYGALMESLRWGLEGLY